MDQEYILKHLQLRKERTGREREREREAQRKR